MFTVYIEGKDLRQRAEITSELTAEEAKRQPVKKRIGQTYNV